MTAPVDIAAAVELVETRLGNRGGGFAYREMTRDEEWLLLKAFKALADERRDIEQRTAEAIAEMLDERRRDIEASKMFGATEDDPVSIACDAYYDGRIQAFTDAAALVRSRRTP